jgi:hypothetical protein
MARYLRRHGGPLWPVYWATPFLRFGLEIARDGLDRETRRSKHRSQ